MNKLLKDQLEKFNIHDLSFQSFNKEKYANILQIIHYIHNQKIPNTLDKELITLLSLYDYFQKHYVLKKYTLYRDIMEKISYQIPWKTINIVSKANNFPHLIGVSIYKNDVSHIPLKDKIKIFLDGVLYQWILMNSNENFALDFQKIEVFPWLSQTLSNPTYILPKSAVKIENTKISADLFFIKQIYNSNKYSFHLVALKNENRDNFTFVSQFAIEKSRYYRLYKMFDLAKALYVYEKPR